MEMTTIPLLQLNVKIAMGWGGGVGANGIPMEQNIA
jgi:hypothetical protein